MNDGVKGLREARVAETEGKIIAAARDLFVRNGYHATTLAGIADAAAVGHRTVYLRFGTKAALLKRVTDIAVAGDPEPLDVTHRDWFQAAFTGDTLDARIAALARGTADLMQRAGDLFEVVQQAQAAEPLLSEASQAGREATREHLHTFVRQAIADGLVPPPADPDWLAETVALVGHADTYLLLRRTTGWAGEDYHSWLTKTLHHLFAEATRRR
ncbi:MAG TPA: helix-turn-helix domain-containing protein [Amycolatopsis sp.]|nr:helix-turn-helix domain-containing protein [Amycolatopsis sp.]